MLNWWQWSASWASKISRAYTIWLLFMGLVQKLSTQSDSLIRIFINTANDIKEREKAVLRAMGALRRIYYQNAEYLFNFWGTQFGTNALSWQQYLSYKMLFSNVWCIISNDPLQIYKRSFLARYKPNTQKPKWLTHCGVEKEVWLSWLMRNLKDYGLDMEGKASEGNEFRV